MCVHNADLFEAGSQRLASAILQKVVERCLFLLYPSFTAVPRSQGTNSEGGRVTEKGDILEKLAKSSDMPTGPATARVTKPGPRCLYISKRVLSVFL